MKHASFKPVFALTLLALLCSNAFSQSKGWAVTDGFEKRCFIENLGQFDEHARQKDQKVHYGSYSKGFHYYFTNNGLVLKFNKRQKKSRKEIKEYEKWYEQQLRNKGIEKEKEEDEKENPKYKFKLVPIYQEMRWEGCNGHAVVTVEDPLVTHYLFPDKGGKKNLDAKGYKKLTYHEIYPGIDAVFYFPENGKGIKYNYILRKGADASVIREKWLGGAPVTLEENGDLLVESNLGILSVAKPVSYKASTKEEVNSEFWLEKNTVGYHLDQMVGEEDLVIDPFMTTPAFTGGVTAMDVDFDVAGNTYVYGGSAPFDVLKYSPSGTLLWLYEASLFTSGLYGDFAVDRNSGSVYMVNGFAGGGVEPNVLKINSSGGFVADHFGSSDMNEMWRMAFSSCSNQAVIGGGGTSGTDQICYLDTNLTSLTTVNVLSTSYSYLDIALLQVDNYGSTYFLHANNGVYLSGHDNNVVKAPVPTFLPMTWSVPSGHYFREVGSVTYSTTNGFNGMAIGDKTLFTYDSYVMKKRSASTGALLISKRKNYPVSDSTNMSWGGISSDDCLNVFIGSHDTIFQYDSNLVMVNFYPQPGTVTDVRVSNTGIVHACGDNFVTAFAPASLTACGSPIFPNLDVTDATCYTLGDATINPSGGVAPYTVTWSTGSSADSIGGLIPGSYWVTISDASCSGNLAHIDFTITNGPGGFITNTVVENVSCNGLTDGSISLSPSGGISPYTYAWDTLGITDSAATGLGAATYLITITDSAGCMNYISVTVNEPGPVGGTINAGAINCNGQTADIVCTPTGGTGPYTIVWNGTTTNDTLYNASAGIYTITVTDDNGCSGTFTDTLVEPPLLTLSIATDSVGCSGTPLGSMTATAGGGTGSYDYLWSNNASNNTPNNPGLTAGVYTLTVTDDNGCTVTVTDTVFDLDFPSIVFNDVLPCNSGSNGSITAVPSGGSSATTFNYAWNTSPVQTGLTANGISAGTYTLSVTANGCTETHSYTLSEKPIIDTLAITGVSCGGSSTIELFVPAGAQPGYQWYYEVGPIPGETGSSFVTNVSSLILISASWHMNGCLYSTANIVLETYPIASNSKIPNIFSPNGDAANNKFYAFTFIPGTDPAVISYLFTEYSVQVYNRWGQLMFETTDPNEGWKGDDLGGTAAAEGVYYVILKYKALCSDSPDAVIYNGTVQVVR